MKTMIAAAALTFLGATPTIAQNISPNGSRPSAKGPAEYFTGTAIVDPLFAANPHMASIGGHVTFEPGARSAWHTHPAGQVLIVTSGTGWTQEEGGEKRVIKPGDVIWCPPGVKHWHGATATTSMGPSPLRTCSMARTSYGWRRSATSNTPSNWGGRSIISNDNPMALPAY